MSIWVCPPFAAAHPDNQTWALAWVSESGLWFVRSDQQDQYTLRSPFRGTLFAGDTDTTRLQMSDDAEQLVVFEQPRNQAGGSVRVYDLRPQWIQRVLGGDNALSEREIIELACGIVRRDTATSTDSENERERRSTSEKTQEAEPTILRQSGSPCEPATVADKHT